MGRRKRFALLGKRDWLLARIAAVPDLTGRVLRAELAERGIKVSYDAVWRFLCEERPTFKKASLAKLAGRLGVPRRPDRWLGYDETGCVGFVHGVAGRGDDVVCSMPDG